MMKSVSSKQACHSSIKEVAELLDVNLSNGLDREEVVRRRSVHGWNDFDITEDTPLWKKYLEQVSGLDVLDCSIEFRSLNPFPNDKF